MKKQLIAVGTLGIVGCGWAQTPPIQPQTPPITVPGRVTVPPPAQSEVENRPLTADEAARIALQRQPLVEAARASIEAAIGRTQAVRAGLGPSVTLGAGYTRTEVLSGSGAAGGGVPDPNGGTGGNVGGAGGAGGTTNVRTSVAVNQLLFDFNRTRDQVRQQAALESAARENLTRVQADLVLQVKQRFYDLAQARRLTLVSEGNLTNRQAQLAVAQARLNEGLGAPADVVRARTSLADAVIALTQARAGEETSRLLLAEALGVDPRTPIEPALDEEPVEPVEELQSMVDTALRLRPEIRQAQASIRAAELGVAVARRGNNPSVNLSLGLNGRGESNPFDSQNASLGINLSWPIFDSGLTAGRTRTARADEQTARADLRRTELTVVGEVSRSYVDLLTAEQRLVSSIEQLANARELVRLAEGRYRGGIGTFLEITDAQNSLFAAERNVEGARGDVARARAALRRATGRALDGLARVQPVKADPPKIANGR